MAKELPYFKFEPSMWDTGSIQLIGFDVQGVFINLCSFYWQRLGDLPYKLAVQKICGGNATALQTLCDEDIIAVRDDKIYISFLDEQLSEFDDISNKNRENARKRWEKRNKDATAMRPQCDRNAIREEKRREDKEINISFDDFWNLYDKKISKVKCESKWKKLNNKEREQIIKTLPDWLNQFTDKQYQPYPITYLNQRRWEDEIKNKTNGKKEIYTAKSEYKIL